MSSQARERRSMMWVLLVVVVMLPVLVTTAGLGDVGPLELGVWGLLFLGWLVAFFTWARNPPER